MIEKFIIQPLSPKGNVVLLDSETSKNLLNRIRNLSSLLNQINENSKKSVISIQGVYLSNDSKQKLKMLQSEIDCLMLKLED